MTTYLYQQEVLFLVIARRDNTGTYCICCLIQRTHITQLSIGKISIENTLLYGPGVIEEPLINSLNVPCFAETDWLRKSYYNAFSKKISIVVA